MLFLYVREAAVCRARRRGESGKGGASRYRSGGEVMGIWSEEGLVPRIEDGEWVWEVDSQSAEQVVVVAYWWEVYGSGRRRGPKVAVCPMMASTAIYHRGCLCSGGSGLDDLLGDPTLSVLVLYGGFMANSVGNYAMLARPGSIDGGVTDMNAYKTANEY